MNEREGFESCVFIIGFIIHNWTRSGRSLSKLANFNAKAPRMQAPLRDAIRRHHLGALHTVDLAAAFDKPMDGN